MQSAGIVAPWQGSLLPCPRSGHMRALRYGASTAWQWRAFRICSGGIENNRRPVEKQETPVPDDLAEVRYQVALANRMLANEGVLDAFGHVSLRHPTDPGRYLLSRSPGLIEAADILEFTLDSAPVAPPTVQLYAERVIHVAAIMGETVPFWDQRDDFGDTNLLVVKQEEGRSLARALGPHSAVLMRRHGATVVGANVRELVFRSIAMCQNAEYQMRALALGSFGPLTPGETKLAAAINLSPGPLARAWEYWTARAESARR
jgi:ribulose-5-phosphate 4-epimerase/fuculose-1-phosphate aldolase